MPSSTESDAAIDQAYDRIAASGLFDPAFYRATYGLLPDEDPLRHFLEKGLAGGRLASAKFDPALYRLAVPDVGSANPLLHYLDRKDRLTLPRLDNVCRELIAKYGKKGERWPNPTPEQLQQHRAYREQFARERTIHVDIAGRDYRIEVPPPEFFFDRLRRDEPFAFARLPHGFWDAWAMRDQIAAEPPLAPLPPPERRVLACRIGRFAKPFHGGFVEGFDEEIAALIPDHRDSAQFFKSVAFKGFPTPDEDLFNLGTPPEERTDRLALLARTFATGDRLLDAILWKRLAYSGDLAALPPLCRNRHVVVLARDYFDGLNRRWELPRFTHITIPRQVSHLIRWQLFDQLQTALTAIAREPGPRPVVFMQCGGSLAYWLISRLFAWNSSIFYIDLGQALNIWFMDLKDTHGQMWTRYYDASAKPGAGH